jgi:hypothetical protein
MSSTDFPKMGTNPATLPWRITSAPYKIVGAKGEVVANLTALDLPNAELIVASVNNNGKIPLEVQCMADCMDMVRQELIEAGVIDANVAPMFVANAVVKKLQEVSAAIKGKSPAYTELSVK